MTIFSRQNILDRENEKKEITKMRRLLCGLLLCVVVLEGCQTQKQNTDTPESPAHNVPSAVYPGPNNTNPQVATQTSVPYPPPQVQPTANPASEVYPAPGATAVQNPASDYAPAPGDEKMTPGNAFVTISASSVAVSGSTPGQVTLQLRGTLPNPCYHLRIDPAQPDDQKQIQVKVYSVVEPDKMCTDVIEEFDVEYALGSFPSGHYMVYINGEYLGEFDI
jgi:hypothetical protein